MRGSRAGGTYRGIEFEVLFTGILAELVQGENVCKQGIELDKTAGTRGQINAWSLQGQGEASAMVNSQFMRQPWRG